VTFLGGRYGGNKNEQGDGDGDESEMTDCTALSLCTVRYRQYDTIHVEG
jgi:hypothetical protein